MTAAPAVPAAWHVMAGPGAGEPAEPGETEWGTRPGTGLCVSVEADLPPPGVAGLRSPGVAGSRARPASGPGSPGAAGLRSPTAAGPRSLAVKLACKRAFDIVIGLLLLALSAPVLLALTLAVRLESRRPALFRQARIVSRGRQAWVIKLRTLPDSGDPDTCWAAPLARATRLGRFLRSSHLDELPQLVNVVRGEMSLVGPRPERPYFVRRFMQEIPGYSGRLRMRAGLTGWAQIHGLNGDTSIAARAELDNAYIDNWSIWLDLLILARTARNLLTAIAAPAGGRRAPEGTR
jgi:lipopolysaccharide/colanic/teichoic acid biosynthesis glycosyltransferase